MTTIETSEVREFRFDSAIEKFRSTQSRDKTGANTYARSLEALWGLRDLGTLV